MTNTTNIPTLPEISPIRYETRYKIQLKQCGRYVTVCSNYTREDAQAIIDAPSNKTYWASLNVRIKRDDRVATFGVLGIGQTVPGRSYTTLETARKHARRYNRNLPVERYYVGQCQSLKWVRVA